MTAQIAAYGRLVADPQLKTTSKGTQMAMASMAVPLPCSQADDGTATMWLPDSAVRWHHWTHFPDAFAGYLGGVCGLF